MFFLFKKRNKKISHKGKSLEFRFEAYEEGVESLEKGDVLFAAKNLMRQKFCFPNQINPKSALMAAYSYYIQDYYGDAISEL